MPTPAPTMTDAQINNAFKILATPTIQTTPEAKKIIKKASDNQLVSWFNWYKTMLRKFYPIEAQNELLTSPTPTPVITPTPEPR